MKKNLSLISYSLSLKNTWAQGRYNFTDDGYRTLKQIADADPMVKGRAVYNAQVMLMTVPAMQQRFLYDTEHNESQSLTTTDSVLIGDIYPNPAKNEATLDYTIKTKGDCYFMLFDITSKLIMKEKLLPENNTLNISTYNMEHGLYLYNVILNKRTVKAGKLIIIK